MVAGIGVGQVVVFGLITFLLVGGTIGIAVLCWVWMRASRASQGRMEARNDEIVSLLRSQNDLLRRILNQRESGS